MLVLTAILKTNEGKSDAVIEEFKKLQPIVLKDPGTLGYTICRANDDPNKLLVFEQYENQDALKYHGQTEHFKAFGAATRGMFAARAELTLWTKMV